MTNQQHQSDTGTEILLVDILHFLKGAWKISLIFGVIGIALGIAYLATTPKQYQASVQIAMAQISDTKNSISLQGVNIEEPTLLIARLSSPTSLTPQAMAACGLQDQANAGILLNQLFKLTPAKGVANVVDLQTFGPTPQVAHDCALGIFDLIKVTQAQIASLYIEVVKVKLANDEELLAKAKDLITRTDKSGLVISASYLSTRDEIRFLLDEITSLKNVITSSQNRPTRMLAPIYANYTPLGPKKPMVLAVGLFGGIFFGLLIALARSIMSGIKS